MAEDKRLRPGCAPPKLASAGERRRRRTIAPARGLDRALFQKLSEGEWIDAATISPWSVRPRRQKLARLRHRPESLPPTIGPSLSIAGRSSLRGPGRCAEATARHPRLIKSLGRADLLILDDFGLETLDARRPSRSARKFLRKRYGRRSTVVTSQLPLSAWHEVIGDHTYADAILDRLVHQCASHRVDRREPCAAPRVNIQNGLTRNPVREKNFLKPTSAAPRADHLVTGGRQSSRNPGAIIPL